MKKYVPLLLIFLFSTLLFAVKTTDNPTIDSFFNNIEKTDKKLSEVNNKLARIQNYLVLAITNPEQLIAQTVGQDMATAMETASNLVDASVELVLKLDPQVLQLLFDAKDLKFMSNTNDMLDDLKTISSDVQDISKSVQDLAKDAGKIPGEAKNLSPLKIPAVLKNVKNAVSQIENMTKTVAELAELVPTTIQLATAIVSNQETEITMKLASSLEDSSKSNKKGKSTSNDSSTGRKGLWVYLVFVVAFLSRVIFAFSQM